MDRNATVTGLYAAAMGYLARAVSDEQLSRSAKFLQRLYFESEDDRHRMISGDVAHAMAKNATDKVNANAADFFPLIQLARQDDNEQVRTNFEDAWKETNAGPRSVVVYLKEIVTLASEHISSPKWTVKHAAALTIGASIEALVKSHGEMKDQDSDLLWPPLKLALAERTWEGKEKVLGAFVTYVEKSGSFWQRQGDISGQIAQVSANNLLPAKPRKIVLLAASVNYRSSILDQSVTKLHQFRKLFLNLGLE